MKKLDLGCGPQKKMGGAIGVDIRPAPHVDVVHDLNVYPYPFKDNEFDHIEMSHIIEHMQRPLYTMSEVHRIACPGATVRIVTPHYTSQLSYGDMEHFHRFGYITFLSLQNTGLFRIRKHKIHFTDFYKILGIPLFANLATRRWEKYFSFLFPALYVEVLLEVVKSEANPKRLVEDYIY